MDDNQEYTPQNQIITLFPTDKTGLSIRDSLGLDDPKIQFKLFPTKQGQGQAVDFWINAHVARLLFMEAKTGRLSELAASHNKKHDPAVGFDLYAKMPNGYRTFTIKNNEGGGVWLSIVNKGGDIDGRQSVPIPAFTLASISMAVLSYLQAYGALNLARQYVPQESGENSVESQETSQGAESESATRPDYELVTTPTGNLVGDLSNTQLSRLIASNLASVTKYMKDSAKLVVDDRKKRGEW